MTASKNETLKELGRRVKRFRTEKGLTQEKLADQLGISRVYMGYIEQGRESPSLKLLMKMSRKFDIKLEDLFHK